MTRRKGLRPALPATRRRPGNRARIGKGLGEKGGYLTVSTGQGACMMTMRAVEPKIILPS
jgi:hypothetical protein